jgi:hypothetical protein
MTMLLKSLLTLTLAGSIASQAHAASPGEEGFRRLGGGTDLQDRVSNVHEVLQTEIIWSGAPRRV